jgi:hypothetical protein
MTVKKTKRELELLKECKLILAKNPKLKKRKLNKIKDLEKRLYYIKVWSITESMPIHTLKNYEKRCYYGPSCHHLDHVLPISYGFHNKIPPEKIGHISNLRFIPSEENIKKGYKLTEESNKILKKIKRVK